MSSEEFEVDGVIIDRKKVDLMLAKIIIKERNNIKTKQFNDSEMVVIIKKIIEEELKCY
jgi:hypothetical protein